MAIVRPRSHVVQVAAHVVTVFLAAFLGLLVAHPGTGSFDTATASVYGAVAAGLAAVWSYVSGLVPRSFLVASSQSSGATLAAQLRSVGTHALGVFVAVFGPQLFAVAEHMTNLGTARAAVSAAAVAGASAVLHYLLGQLPSGVIALTAPLAVPEPSPAGVPQINAPTGTGPVAQAPLLSAVVTRP